MIPLRAGQNAQAQPAASEPIAMSIAAPRN
jgi:hypothetical protein